MIALTEKIQFINIIKRNKKYYMLIFSIYLFILSVQMIINDKNYSNFIRFWLNCPFIITDDKYNYERRCELINIDSYSIYSYQYICSYDASKEFKNKKKYILDEEKYKNSLYKNIIDFIKCDEELQLIVDNKILSFSQKYKDKKIFYCMRINRPEEFSFAKDKDCKNITYISMKLFFFFIIFQSITCSLFLVCYIRIKCSTKKRQDLRNIIINNDGNNNINNNNNNNTNNIANCSTRISDNKSINENNDIDNSKNIIIENKIEYIIFANINDISNKQ